MREILGRVLGAVAPVDHLPVPASAPRAHARDAPGRYREGGPWRLVPLAVIGLRRGASALVSPRGVRAQHRRTRRSRQSPPQPPGQGAHAPYRPCARRAASTRAARRPPLRAQRALPAPTPLVRAPQEPAPGTGARTTQRRTNLHSPPASPRGSSDTPRTLPLRRRAGGACADATLQPNGGTWPGSAPPSSAWSTANGRPRRASR